MRVPLTPRLGLRAAARIHQQLVKPPAPLAPHLSLSLWDDLVRIRRQWERCGRFRWPHAQQHLLTEAEQLAKSLQFGLETFTRQLREQTCPPPVFATREIFLDLLALEEEFPQVQLDLKKHTLTVTTEEIELSDVALGPFAIGLDWHRLQFGRAYAVQALEPNPSRGERQVVHPHVDHDELCEGNGRGAIRNALQQGRLFDFFLLVRQVLRTYNPESAYVELLLWDGKTCDTCGIRHSSGRFARCAYCSVELCEDCLRDCRGCHDDCCPECLDACPGCDESPFCATCLTPCVECDTRYCEECLDAGCCPNCRVSEESPDEESDPPADHEDTVPKTLPAVHALRLGQAPVPA